MIDAEIKAAKKARGNWFKRTWEGYQLRQYHKLQKKFDGVEPTNELETILDRQLSKMEAFLDKAMEEQQCSAADSR